jgi:hypothetical protein
VRSERATLPVMYARPSEVELMEADRTVMVARNCHAVGDFDRLLASAFVSIDADGVIRSRAEYLATLADEWLESMQVSDQHARVFGDAGVVTAVLRLLGYRGAAAVDGRYRCTHVYVRYGSEWSLVSAHECRAP